MYHTVQFSGPWATHHCFQDKHGNIIFISKLYSCWHSKQPFKITKNSKSKICKWKLIEEHKLNSLGFLENLQNGKPPLAGDFQCPKNLHSTPCRILWGPSTRGVYNQYCYKTFVAYRIFTNSKLTNYYFREERTVWMGALKDDLVIKCSKKKNETMLDRWLHVIWPRYLETL